MIIGEDYNKIEFELFGLDLVEPNAFIGDFILFIICLLFAYKTFRLNYESPFFRNMAIFFVVLGFGFFVGGLGHLFFKYFGVSGRSWSWFLSIVSMVFIERAMVSIHPNKSLVLILKRLINIKLILALTAELFVLYFVDLSNDVAPGLRVTLINSTIGAVYVFGILGRHYSSIYTKSFNYLLLSIILVFPTLILQIFKINFHPWFDRNDASHIFLALGVACYFMCVKGYYRYSFELEND